jgi:hypothetical protein
MTKVEADVRPLSVRLTAESFQGFRFMDAEDEESEDEGDVFEGEFDFLGSIIL